MSLVTQIRSQLLEAPMAPAMPAQRILARIRFADYGADEWADAVSAVDENGSPRNVPPELLPKTLLQRLYKRGDARLVNGKLQVRLRPHIGYHVTYGNKTVGLPKVLHGHVTVYDLNSSDSTYKLTESLYSANIDANLAEKGSPEQICDVFCGGICGIPAKGIPFSSFTNVREIAPDNPYGYHNGHDREFLATSDGSLFRVTLDAIRDEDGTIVDYELEISRFSNFKQ